MYEISSIKQITNRIFSTTILFLSSLFTIIPPLFSRILSSFFVKIQHFLKILNKLYQRCVFAFLVSIIAIRLYIHFCVITIINRTITFPESRIRHLKTIYYIYADFLYFFLYQDYPYSAIKVTVFRLPLTLQFLSKFSVRPVVLVVISILHLYFLCRYFE